ncbi:MAG: hypothetical protein MZW92_39630 [Comamonadaceae bacterium]|nr:hypothetical protein [Comamonadaceae bacterium]
MSRAALRARAALDGDDLPGVRADRAADGDGKRAVGTTRLRGLLAQLLRRFPQSAIDQRLQDCWHASDSTT